MNPLTHVVSLVRRFLYGSELLAEGFWEPSLWTSIIVIIATALFYGWALRVCKRVIRAI